jgi:DMSO/TMAO reductase YedYZ heme-binding membrane subunit
MTSILFFIFRLHDFAASWFAQHFRSIKIGLLLIAHLSLFGFFFPELRKTFGELAGNLLIGILFISPISKIVRVRFFLQIMSIRRELGILMAYLATVHAVGYLMDPAWAQGEIFPHYTEWQNGYLFGILAYMLTLPLLLTSNTLAQKYLGGTLWKRVHRVVYLMFIFAVLHRFFITTGGNGTVGFAFIEAGVLIGSYGLLKILAWRNFIAPLRLTIEWVERKHSEYKAQKSLS